MCSRKSLFALSVSRDVAVATVPFDTSDGNGRPRSIAAGIDYQVFTSRIVPVDSR